MTESNDITQAGVQEQRSMDFEAGQKHTTLEGKEYTIDFIARESGNIEDLFVVYKRTSDERDDDTERYYLKKTTDIKSADDFDEAETGKSGPESLDVSVGQKYTHFKTGDSYIVKAIAYDSKGTYVIYEGQYDSPEFGHHPIWVREYEDFAGMKVFGENELDNNGQPKAPVKRFALIS